MVVSVPNTDATEPTCPSCTRPLDGIDLPNGAEALWCGACEAIFEAADLATDEG
jgi:LSD1 subclass zinc finger protein